MSWKYGLKKNSDGWLELTEIYEDDCYTADPIVISGDNYQELIDNLRMIVQDLEDPLIIDIKGEDK